ncbi:dTDP-4-dehydrorhamnose reductase [Sphingomonas sp. MAH-20]|uniref:dTDP-4-dehydrorhamnose reductase n=1 Tax=Sphingomonas horti TaxID=2682842 RepID=A0A6I4J3N9_9SPHN|nr:MULTISPECIES: dTDP-4-dehydrorhamnose reductase [Sphingomonas]MBA2921130.1 dTDP-4-dehydrorhamnose reductase [Sphingomonas sp. CGMCC 1.13658]MVO79372.1 dTDP-4-dehydrorhamnose reductase [Sphingomonas horti]
MTPIFVTGGTGQVGTALRALGPRFGVEIVAPGRDALDLTSPASIEAAVASRDWGAVINGAAYTAVDKAESEPEAAYAVNAVAPERLALATAARGIRLLHVSTDYVFDGSKAGFYTEDDPVAPLGVYGASKEAGERGVRAGNPDHIILRTAWVVSPWGHNFVKTMLRLGAERASLRVVDDQRGCPTSAVDIAETLLTIATKGGPAGAYHFVNAGEASWCDLARFVFERAGMDVDVEAITTADYPTPARRPANSRLSTDKLERTFGIRPRLWQDAVGAVVDTLKGAQ